MLSQTRYAIDKLKKSGFKRSEFSCRVRRHYYTDHVTGRRAYEWGGVDILLKTSRDRIWELLPAMLEQGLGVTVYVMEDGTYSTPFVTNDERWGKLRLIHLGHTNSWGGALYETLEYKTGAIKIS
jgi:hypothetical protein